MPTHAFACGEPLCKASFEAELRPDKPWPVKCPGCGRSLYPDSMLRASSLENLDPYRGPLMQVVGSSLVPVTESELTRAAAGQSRSLLDEIAEATDAARSVSHESRAPLDAARGKKSSLALVIIVALGVLTALALAWAILR